MSLSALLCLALSSIVEGSPTQNSGTIPGYMLPIINTTGKMSMAAADGNQKLIDELKNDGWILTSRGKYDSGLVIYTWDKQRPNGTIDRIIAFKPTNPSSWKDWAVDAWQLLTAPEFTDQYRDALRFARQQQEVKDKDPNLTLTFTGWSLGGGIAQYLSLELGTKTVVFNAAALSQSYDIFMQNLGIKDRQARARVGENQILNLRQRDDLVSGYGSKGITPVAELPAQYGQIMSLDPSGHQASGVAGLFHTHDVQPILDSVNAIYDQIGSKPGHGSGTASIASNRNSGALGGVDFTSIRLAYVPAAKPGAKFSGLFVASQENGNLQSEATRRGYRLATQAFCAALTISPSAFWVNLNPSEPDRIADKDLGQTDIARVLLEADLRMKKDAASITDPRSSDAAKEYWHRLRLIAGNGDKISQHTRFWIVPGYIEIVGSDAGVYLAHADLKVNLESKRFSAGQNTGSDALTAAERVSEEFVQPRLTELVNHASQYEELRQVYSSLILAAWHRRRSTADSHVCSGVQLPPRNRSEWTPKRTWLEYRNSIEKGEYNFSETTATHIVHYFSGGVDFTSIAIPPVERVEEGTAIRLFEADVGGRPVFFSGSLLFSTEGATKLGLTAVSGEAAQSKAETESSALDGSSGVLMSIIVALVCVILLLVAVNRRRRLGD